MSTMVTVIASWFGCSILVALLIGRVMSFAKRNDPPEMPLFLPAPRAHLPALVVPYPAFAQAPRIKRSA
jgi:hypothetical protein